MSNPLAGVNMEHWWALVPVIGTVILVASLAVHDRGGLGLGLGMIFFGIGEIINHPRQETLIGMRAKITAYPWRPRPHGLIFDLIGVAVMARGGWLALGL